MTETHATSAASSGDQNRAAILEKRRALRKAKKEKAKHFKEQKKRQRDEKKKDILAKIRAKREADKQANDATGCWLCGESDHRKQDCPNKESGDLTKTCFHCRRRGHTANNCPKLTSQNGSNPLTQDATAAKACCFNCGATDHSLRDCLEERVNGGATYATCFVCNQMGHLSSKCPKSTTGIYPKGGCCKLCKSKLHLARDCPAATISTDGTATKPNKKTNFDDDDEVSAPVASVDDGGDALDDYDIPTNEDEEEDDKEAQKEAKEPPKKRSKRVKF